MSAWQSWVFSLLPGWCASSAKCQCHTWLSQKWLWRSFHPGLFVFVLVWNVHKSHHLNHFKVYSSVVIKTFMRLYDHCCHLVPEHFTTMSFQRRNFNLGRQDSTYVAAGCLKQHMVRVAALVWPAMVVGTSSPPSSMLRPDRSSSWDSAGQGCTLPETLCVHPASGATQHAPHYSSKAFHASAQLLSQPPMSLHLGNTKDAAGA